VRDIIFADIGEGIHEGVLRQWSVQPGDAVKEGQTLYIIETDKVTAEIPSPVDGTVSALLARVGDTVPVGAALLRIDDGSGEAAPTPEAAPAVTTETVEEQGSTSVVGQLVVSSEVIAPSAETLPESGAPEAGRKVLATPVARKMARDLGVDINTLTGTGPAGRIMKEDIRRAAAVLQPGAPLAAAPAAPAVQASVQAPAPAPSAGEAVPLSMLRKTIARNMVLSKTTIPHAAAMDELDVTELAALRESMKETAKAEGVPLTFMGFILKAVAIALKAHPKLNASLSPDGEQLLLHGAVNLGIAVDTPEGLMVPVIHDADKRGILELAAETARLAESCRSRTVKLPELQGGTFSITNYGSGGTLFGLPVIKSPEAAILGVGTITKKPVVREGEIVIRDMLMLTLCFDHRIVDGGDAARFMNDVKRLLTQPLLLLLK